MQIILPYSELRILNAFRSNSVDLTDADVEEMQNRIASQIKRFTKRDAKRRAGGENPASRRRKAAKEPDAVIVCRREYELGGPFNLTELGL